MKIEILDKVEEEEYILHVPTIKVTDYRIRSKFYIHADFFKDAGLKCVYHSLHISLCESLFISFMLESKTIQLITWAACISFYSYKHGEECPIWSKKNDKIWENLIKVGIVELRGKE